MRVSSSLFPRDSYLDPKTISARLFCINLENLFISLGLNEPSALKIKKYFVFTFFIPNLKASPYPLFFERLTFYF